MSELGELARGGVKQLGPGALLVNVLPSAVLVVSLLSLISSRLYPWLPPLYDRGHPVAPGLESVIFSATRFGVPGVVAVVFAIALVAILLRPFQISVVQLLEGYWGRPSSVKAFAVECHQRRRSRAELRKELRDALIEPRDAHVAPVEPRFSSVADYERARRRLTRLRERGTKLSLRYPAVAADVMPTSLGNILRRGETTAGERYGLTTVKVYPRLFHYLSDSLSDVIGNQLDVLDATAALVVFLSVEAVMAAPLLFRFDWWSLVPVGFVVVAAVAYRGARMAAEGLGERWAAAFDLHRFDVLRAMHLPLPKDAAEEYERNQQLSAFLSQDVPLPEFLAQRFGPTGGEDNLTYFHPSPDGPELEQNGKEKGQSSSGPV